jgi:hypothetical protein
MHSFTAKLEDNLMFNPSNSMDKYIIEKDLKIGEHYKIKVTKGRSLISLGEYWLIMKAFSYYRFKGDDTLDKYLHSVFKRAFFGAKEVVNPITKKTEQVEPSISFDKLPDEVKFKEYLKFVKDKLKEFDVDSKELISDYKGVI